MSRSRRKTPIVGHTTCGSEREDKKLWHQRWRTRERTALTSASPEALSAHLPLLENQASSVWSMGKDGRSYWPVKRQAATADRIANHKGRNPQERLPEKAPAYTVIPSKYLNEISRHLFGVVSENGIYGHSRFCNTDFDDKLACLNLSGV
jgi:hypothetical protein